MRVFFFIGALIALLVVSCVPADPYSPMNTNYRATANAALEYDRWQEAARLATQQAPIVRITETAAALSIQSTQAQATSVAGMQTQAAVATGTAYSVAATSTQSMQNAESTAIANAALLDDLKREREQYQNEFWKIAPLLAVIFAALVAGWLMITISRRERFRPAATDANGNVLPVIDVVDHRFTDIDSSPNFSGTVSMDLLVRLLAYLVEKKSGMPAQLPQVTAERQDKVKERDQMVDLASRGIPGQNNENKKLAVQQMEKLLPGPTLESRWKDLDEASALEVIDGVIIQDLHRSWKEAE